MNNKTYQPEEMISIENVKHGEFVRRKENSVKTYQRAEYDRELKKYCLNDQDDISRCIYIKKGTKVFVGFTY
jgi:hypothetical protein